MAPMTRLTRLLTPLAFTVLGGSLLLGCGGQNPYQSAASSTTVAATVTIAASEPVAAGGTENSLAENVFTPEANISSCVGTLERPDCGTKTKGGWHMTLVFTVLIGGLAFVFWRVGRGVRQRDAVVNRVTDEQPPTPAKVGAPAEAASPPDPAVSHTPSDVE